MATRRLQIGDVLLVQLPQQLPPGHEQLGARPAVVIAELDLLGTVRYPVAVIAPVTTDHSQPWALQSPALYPTIPAGAGGLTVASRVLLDQVRIISVERITRQIGRLPESNYAPIQTGLRRMMKL